MARALLALGSNQGDRAANLNGAVERLGASGAVRVVSLSRWQATAPAGGPSGQGEFLNGAVVVETTLTPLELLDWALEIEQQGGRERREFWGPRAIDIDLLLYENRACRTPRLELPHRRMAYRRFVLEPACEIAGDWVHPTIGWTIERLTEHAREAPLYVALTGLHRDSLQQIIGDVLRRSPGKRLLDPAAPDGLDPAAWRARRARLLAEAAREPRDVLRISDFWIDAPLATVPSGDPSATVEMSAASIDNGSDCVLQPKLLAYVEAPGPHDRAQRRTLRDAVERPGRGPWLMLDAADLTRCVDELSGAIQALQWAEAGGRDD